MMMSNFSKFFGGNYMKGKKKALSLLIVLSLLFCMVPYIGMTAKAEEQSVTLSPGTIVSGDISSRKFSSMGTVLLAAKSATISTRKGWITKIVLNKGDLYCESFSSDCISVTPGNASLGEEQIVVTDINAKPVTVSRKDPQVIIAFSSIEVYYDPTLGSDIPVSGITLNEASLAFNEGDEAQLLTATVSPDDANDKTVTWSSSDTSVATVDMDGDVTPVGVGTAIITATATNGTDDDTSDDKTATCTVTVTGIASVTSAPTAKTLTYNKSAQVLVSAGTAENGTMQYATSENGPFSSDIPTGFNAGIYNVWYKAKGNEGYNDSEVAGPIEVTIAKADPETPTLQLSANVGQTLLELPLPAGWAWDDPSTALTEPGDTTFPAHFTENANYNGKTADVPVAVFLDVKNTSGNGGEHTKDQDENLPFVFEITGLIDDTYQAFIDAGEVVTVTGKKYSKQLTKDTDFTATPGSLKLTLTKEYLDSLDAGNYKVTAKFTMNGVTVEGSSTFTIAAPSSAPVPNTGDDTNTAVIISALMLFMLSLAIIVYILFVHKRVLPKLLAVFSGAFAAHTEE